MNPGAVIDHLKSALSLGCELFVSTLLILIRQMQSAKLLLSREEQYLLQNILIEFSAKYDVSFSAEALRKAYTFLIDNNISIGEDSQSVSGCENEPASGVASQAGGSGPTLYEILAREKTFFKRFNVEGVKLKYRIKEFGNASEKSIMALEKAFDGIIRDVVSNAVAGSKVSFTITLPNSPEIKPIWSSLRPVSELSGKYILDLISNVNQSNGVFLSDEIMQMEAHIVNFPFGGGDTNRTIDPRTEDEIVVLRKKRSVVDVGKSNDFYCLPRSICYAMKMTIEGFSHLSVMKLLDGLARNLCKKANVIVGEQGCTSTDIYKFQKILDGFQIVVFDNLKDSNSILFRIPVENQSLKKIYLYYSKLFQHFYVIKSLTAFFNRKYLCSFCDKVMYHRFHKCEMKCTYCLSSPPCAFVEMMVNCQACNRVFRGENCLSKHIQNKVTDKTVCDTFKICTMCSKFLNLEKRGKDDHKCDEFFCQACSRIVPPEHLCYIKRYRGSADKKFLIIFFDCEATQDTPNGSNSFVHVVNLIVAQQVCYSCYENFDIQQQCNVCGVREHVFEYGNNETDVVGRFLDYCLMHRPAFTNIYCIAHNLQGYDGHFIISELLDRKIDVNPIMNGTKIMRLTCGRLAFIDSLNFLSFPLSKFPSVFDIKDHSKGYYPYFFNTVDNIDYVGKFPSVEMYGYNTMKVKERNDFIQWYNTVSQGVFDNKKEMLMYCKNDVNILRLGCSKFMQEFLNITGINPLIESLTIASACMLVFRRNFLKENTLGIMPRSGYYKSQNQSVLARKWLALESSKTSDEIASVNNKGEVRLERCGLLVDGFNSKTNTVYEFFGCFYHGCRECFKILETSTNVTRKVGTLSQRYESTMKRIDLIKRSGYNLIYSWECNFKQLLKRNIEIRRQLDEKVVNILPPLNPRDAVFGGRTEVFKLHHKVEGDEVIRYLDFTSLYPYINKYAPYPIGHPEIFRFENIPPLEEIVSMHGFITCTVIPPTDLFLPVLPFRGNLKLYFTLCRVCAETNRVFGCDHIQDERQITGTWVIPEVSRAIKNGYKVQEVYEVWKYDFTQYDPITKSGGLFADYVNTFLKIKQEASGWGDKYESEAEKENFIHSYQSREDILLEKDHIHKNPGRRNTAKICLNSFWGKFAQREDRTQTKVFNSSEDFSNFLQSPGIEICSLIPINEETIWVTWRYLEENLNMLPHVNIPIAAYTTAFARMKLYDALKKVGKNILYCDTDSLIFIDSKSNPLSFPISDFLGDLTNEVDCFGKDSYITEFVSTGPKTYGLKIETGLGTEHVVKCKGITINFKNSKVVNFDHLKNLVTGDHEGDSICVVNDSKIKRKRPGIVISTTEKKHLQFTFDKRVVTEENCSYPYGFKRARIQS
ncbi:uncharacterized protein LOC119648487 [Hermetia illucens]|uniref:uncharacterized protein LOC119648487 n=1 Tax=Hermetia illucens TaxID=343691 RepID=UPI0018CC24A0|nr:uncharacterized protein LOC119648487 [Hermetia illucens]